MVTLDQQRHIVAERATSFVAWIDAQVAAKSRVVPASRGVAVVE